MLCVLCLRYILLECPAAIWRICWLRLSLMRSSFTNRHLKTQNIIRHKRNFKFDCISMLWHTNKVEWRCTTTNLHISKYIKPFLSLRLLCRQPFKSITVKREHETFLTLWSMQRSSMTTLAMAKRRYVPLLSTFGCQAQFAGTCTNKKLCYNRGTVRHTCQLSLT